MNSHHPIFVIGNGTQKIQISIIFHIKEVVIKKDGRIMQKNKSPRKKRRNGNFLNSKKKKKGTKILNADFLFLFCSMRKWRAANRDKNKRNDLRCRVYRLAREKFQDNECIEKELFIKEQISRRLGRQRLLMEDKDKRRYSSSSSSSSSSCSSSLPSLPSSPSNNEFYYQSGLPFYNPPYHQIVLPSIKSMGRSKNFFHEVQLPPLQSSPWHSSPKSPLLLQPNPIDLYYPVIPMTLTM